MFALENNTFNAKIFKNQYKRLLERKREIEPQFNKLKDEFEMLNRQIAGLDQALTAAGENTEKLRSQVSPPKPQTERVQEEDTIPIWIYKLLTAVKKPMHYREITKQLVSGGLIIRGKDQANTVLAYISRNKSKFMKVPEAGRGFYKIRE